MKEEVLRADTLYDCYYEREKQIYAQAKLGELPVTQYSPSRLYNAYDIHPRNKKEGGNRLARWALAKDYGKQGVTYSGP
ncbi:MAG: hypothetical protein OCD76_07125 [Reichenbachiella sp.]